MHTGTLIDDLMMMVERVEWNLRHELTEEVRLPILLDLKDPAVALQPLLAGAA